VVRAVCMAPLVDAARAFLADELGWDVIERAQAGPDPDAAVVIVEGQQLGAPQFDGLPHLRLVVSVRGEPANVDLEEATRRGIPVVHAPGRNAESVAEFTIGVMIALLRHVVSTHQLVRSRALTEVRPERHRARRDVTWRPVDPAAVVPYEAFKGRALRSTVLGLLGLGAVGRRVAGLAGALGMPVIGHDPYVGGAVEGVELVSFGELLQRCDVLSLHARGSGPPLIGAGELGRLKPGAVVINTARAAILDYPALTAALADGSLAGAALDVYPDEPLTPDDPLLELGNVILTPHIAGASTDVVRQQWEILIPGLRSLLVAGRPEDAPVRNPAALPAYLARGGLA
jgi:D-3-phosphoglycerate dehydrogenase